MRLLTKISIFLLVLWQLPAFAVLDLELTQGVQKPIPIAVVGFAGQDGAGSDQAIASVISNDLHNSGRFSLVDTTSDQQPHTAADVSFNYWQKQQANYLIVGQVSNVGGSRYQVHYQLINIYGNRSAEKNSAAPAWKNAVLLDQTYTTDGTNDLRRVAHHISDAIYQKITGIRGVFSTRIAYVVVDNSASGEPKQYELQVADYDGYNPIWLLKSPKPIMSPSWSPDGRYLAYASFENGYPNIYVQDLTSSSGARQCITCSIQGGDPSQGGIKSSPAWSPNGRKIAFALSRQDYNSQTDIYSMNVNGLNANGLTRLTNNPSVNTEPDFSPSGNSMLFTSDRGGGPQIYQMSAQGGSASRVTFNGSYNATGSFTPDGNSIVMLHRTGGAFNIAVQDVASSRLVVLTNDGQAQSPSVAPNGQMVLYTTRYGGHNVLAMVSLDKRVQLRLPSGQGDVRQPAWSPFTN